MADTFRVASLSHANDLADPVGFMVDSEVTFLENRPGVNVSPTLCLNELKVKATAKYQKGSNPITPGTTGTVTATLLNAGGSFTTVSIVQMRAGSFNLDANNGSMHTHSQSFEFSNDGTELLTPISISA